MQPQVFLGIDAAKHEQLLVVVDQPKTIGA